MSNATPNAVAMGNLTRLAIQYADQRVMQDIASACDQVDIGDSKWLDTRPMVSHHERSARAVDLAHLTLDYAVARGLLTVHPVHRHLVRDRRA